MRFLVASLLSYALFSTTNAITCRDTYALNDTTCDGDYCIKMGSIYSRNWYNNQEEPDFVNYGCLSGAAYARFNNYCWAIGSQSICVCNTDRCSDSAILPPMRPGSLTCGEKKEHAPLAVSCYGCQSWWEDSGNETSKGQGCNHLSMNSITDLPRPHACFRAEMSTTYSAITCWCDTEDYCADKLASEQTLKSDTVTCYIDNAGNDTCKGDYCFIERSFYEYDNLPAERGCLTVNHTLFSGIFQTGYSRSIKVESVICDSTLCNSNWTTAMNSVSGNPATTTSPSRANIENEMRALLKNIQSAFESFVTDITALFR